MKPRNQARRRAPHPTNPTAPNTQRIPLVVYGDHNEPCHGTTRIGRGRHGGGQIGCFVKIDPCEPLNRAPNLGAGIPIWEAWIWQDRQLEQPNRSPLLTSLRSVPQVLLELIGAIAQGTRLLAVECKWSGDRLCKGAHHAAAADSFSRRTFCRLACAARIQTIAVCIAWSM